MRKILWLHSHFEYWMGGTKLLHQIIQRVHKHIPVTVFVESASQYAKEQYEKAGIELIETIQKTSTSPWYWLNLQFYIQKNIQFLKQYVDNHCLLMSSMFPMNAVWNAFDRPRYQYLFEPFAFIHDDLMVGGLPVMKRLFCEYVRLRYKNLDIESTRKSKTIFTLNDLTRDTIRDVYGVNAIPTYTGIDTDFFKPRDASGLKERYKGRRVLIHSTDFTPIKGTDLAVKALSLVVKKYPNILLLITSTIDDKAGMTKIKELAGRLDCLSNIEYLGFVPYEDLPQYYSFAEMLLQTGVGTKSGATSFSLPVKEAMACGTPVIRHPITAEDAEDGVSGLLIDAKDSEKYAQGILSLLDNPEKARQMGERARERILSRYKWDSVVEILLRNML